jgi:ribonucleoside-diphosphate reductase alpha chain
MPHASSELPAISRDIWDRKYRLKAADGKPVDATLADTWARVARAAAAAEPAGERARRADRFAEAMGALAFLPAGRIIAGAGSERTVTLFNCFVMGPVEDDLGAIFESVKEAALTMQQGGGIGQDFSTLRPAGAPVRSIGADASGPVSFMDVWDAMCRTIMSAGARRGAMMATLRCDHPDIEAFIDAKADPARLRNFNLSVLVTDEFLAAVEADDPWPLRFAGTVQRTVSARGLWQRLMRATYDYAEPGVIFIDRVNRENNLAYCETITATNPCGEQPLPPYGACLLGSINLAQLVERPFSPEAAIPAGRLEETAALAVRLLDDVIDVSRYPLPAQRREALAKRRIGLGVTGLADALVMCGLHYAAPAARARAAGWMAAIQRAAYLASAELAGEKGSFPLFDRERFLAAPGVARLDPEVRAAIARHGIRNGCLTSIAPTGTISLLAGNVSSGVEPIFDLAYRRRVLEADGSAREVEVEDYAHRLYRQLPDGERPPDPAFVTAAALSPAAHLEMQAALQPHVDSAISKTINCPEGLPFESFRDIYRRAHALGLKGCTTFRPNPVTGSVLASAPPTAGLGGGVPLAAAGSAIAAEAPPMPGEPAAASAGGGVGAGERRADRPGAAVAPLEAPATGPSERDGVVYMAPPLARPPALGGSTYKLKWPGSDHALYITINDIEQDGRRRPFEIFINTKNLEHYAWTVALTRMISAVFRRGGDVSFVFEELEAVFDPQGGQWLGGRYVPSLLAAIGEIIETHLVRIGFLHGGEPARHVQARLRDMAGGGEAGSIEDEPSVIRAPGPAGVAATVGEGGLRVGRGEEGVALPGARSEAVRSEAVRSEAGGGPGVHATARPVAPGGPACRRCGRAGLQRREGCWVCDACGDSRCGA